MSETWRDVVGWEDKYQVSDHGNVRSKDITVPDKRTGIRRLKGKMVALSEMDNGYLYVGLCRNGKAKVKQVHVLVLEAFVGPRPPGTLARHYPDQNKHNNKVSNLTWATPKVNAKDRKENGTHYKPDARNENNHNCKLTTEEVQLVKDIVGDGDLPQAVAASMFGISQSLVSCIVNRKKRTYA